jgi:hypothetical protein
MALKKATHTPFFSTSVRPQFWALLGVTLVFGAGFLLGLAVNG